MARTAGSKILLFVLGCIGGISVPCARGQGADCEPKIHGRDYWRQIAKNHYEISPGQAVFPLARELSGYLCSPDPELRDDLAYSILTIWIVRQKQLSNDELLTLAREWKANLRVGIGETGTDSVFRRSFSALSLVALAERDLKDPFLEESSFRTLLEEALRYLRDERDLRGFDAKKGWIHATAHTADLLAALAENRRFTQQDQGRVLQAISQRLATASEIFTYGEQDRLANVAAAIISRDDFDGERWHSWVAEMDKEDSTVWKDSPPQMQSLARFENDSYFLRATIAQTSLRPVTHASTEAQKTILTLLRRR
jgi:hypothetical protein